MNESCDCPPETKVVVRDAPVQNFQYSLRVVNGCPECGLIGKPIHWETIKSLLSVSLRQVSNARYFFCRTQTCPVVYFSADGEQTFTVEQVRERVFQKEPEAQDVFICYCFGHTLGKLRAASSADRIAIVADINTGISAGQCACDLRNPQGSCCLGNVRKVIKHLDTRT